MKSNKINSEKLAHACVHGVQENKAKEIVLLDLRKIDGAVCDFFVVCHGDSTTHVDGIAKSVEREVRTNLKEKPWHREGMENSEWILLDYVNVVVHIFREDTRDFYKIEELWADAVVEHIESEA